MGIYKLLQNTRLGPEEIVRLKSAYELALEALSVKDRDDPLTQLVARNVIEIGQSGVEDPAEISKLAIELLRLR